jgi:protein O-mannosyl-transferase
MPIKPVMRNGIPTSILGILPPIICLFIYLQSLVNGYTNFDDTSYVFNNEWVTSGLSWPSFRWAMTASYMNIWHPLTWLSHQLDVQLFGLNPGLHHLTSALIHAASSFVLFRIFQETTQDKYKSLFVAMVFALHPTAVESVAWISERKDVLSTFFVLATIWTYIRNYHRWTPLRYGTLLILFALGLLSKPTILMLPIILALMDFWPLGRFNRSPSPVTLPNSHNKIWWEKLPLLLMSAATVVLTLMIVRQVGVLASTDQLSVSTRLANAVAAYGTYLGKAFWPSNLAVFYPYPQPPGAFALISKIFLLMGLSVSAWALRRRAPFFLAGWLWFLIYLFPMIGLVQQAQHLVADRYLYFPIIGLACLVAWGVPALMAKARFMGLAVPLLGVILLAAMAITTSQQIMAWRSSVSLFRQAIANTENNHVAHQNLGSAFFAKKDWINARKHFQLSLSVNPFYQTNSTETAKTFLERSLAHLASEASAKGDNRQALKSYNEAIDNNPENPTLHYNAGNILFQFQEFEKAAEHFTKALDLDSDYPDAQNNLGLAFMGSGDLNAAKELFLAILSKEPSNQMACYNLSCVLSRSGELDEALRWLRQSIENGYPGLGQILSDPDLENLREDERFKDLKLSL